MKQALGILIALIGSSTFANTLSEINGANCPKKFSYSIEGDVLVIQALSQDSAFLLDDGATVAIPGQVTTEKYKLGASSLGNTTFTVLAKPWGFQISQQTISQGKAVLTKTVSANKKANGIQVEKTTDAWGDEGPIKSVCHIAE